MHRSLIALCFACSLTTARAQTAPKPHDPGDAGTSEYAQMRDAEHADPTLRARDFAGLRYYFADDISLGKPKPGDQPRVIFFGDSITHNWGSKTYSDLFQRKPNYINRGIGGQTTAQMLLRYRQDVLALDPKIVVFLGGTNDLATYKVPDTLAFIEANIASITELALLHHQRIILCSVTPVTDAIKPQTDRRDPAKILALNTWLKAYAAEKNILYVDYYATLTDGHDRIQTSLTIDGLHPNRDGMAKMETLIETAIASEWKKGSN